MKTNDGRPIVFGTEGKRSLCTRKIGARKSAIVVVVDDHGQLHLGWTREGYL